MLLELNANDGLALEYKLENGLAIRYLNLADVMDNPPLFRVPGVFGYCLPEERFDFGLVSKFATVSDDRGDAGLIRRNRGQAFA